LLSLGPHILTKTHLIFANSKLGESGDHLLIHLNCHWTPRCPNASSRLLKIWMIPRLKTIWTFPRSSSWLLKTMSNSKECHCITYSQKCCYRINSKCQFSKLKLWLLRVIPCSKISWK
jgi:hypothetical protein